MHRLDGPGLIDVSPYVIAAVVMAAAAQSNMSMWLVTRRTTTLAYRARPSVLGGGIGDSATSHTVTGAGGCAGSVRWRWPVR